MLLKTLFIDEIRLLTLRAPSAAIRDHSNAYLAFGLLMTWIAGIGRHWDDPHATLWQHMGLGSVAYVIGFALILWMLLIPLRARNWTYRNVLIFLALTAPPAFLYAIRVEQWTGHSAALTINIAFLGVVAAWRIAMLIFFLKQVAGLRAMALWVAVAMPLVVIVDALAMLGLAIPVLEMMAGLRETGTAEATQAIVPLISIVSALATPMLLACYAWIAMTQPKDCVPQQCAATEH